MDKVLWVALWIGSACAIYIVGRQDMYKIEHYQTIDKKQAQVIETLKVKIEEMKDIIEMGRQNTSMCRTILNSCMADLKELKGVK